MKVEKLDEAFEALLNPMVERIVTRVLSEHEEIRPEIKEPEQFLTIGKASKEFGCSTHLLQKAMNNLELDYYKADNRTYIKRKDVHSYMESIKIRSSANYNDQDIF